MEETNKKTLASNDSDIVCTKAIKAGKRVYYIDVKRNKKNDLFISITESKKVVSNKGNEMQVNYEKHKIFIYKEDFEKVLSGIQESIEVINRIQDSSSQITVNDEENEMLNTQDEIKIDLEF